MPNTTFHPDQATEASERSHAALMSRERNARLDGPGEVDVPRFTVQHIGDLRVCRDGVTGDEASFDFADVDGIGEWRERQVAKTNRSAA